VPTKRVVQLEEDLVRFYLKGVGKHALLTRPRRSNWPRAVEAGRDAWTELTGSQQLTASDQRELRRLVRHGGATYTFMEADFRLVVSIAKRYQAAEVPRGTWFKKSTSV
jgi:DNA-directed RNA polymerase sigma subunit (sigma70/sigma32)